jgi:hypothetical protein
MSCLKNHLLKILEELIGETFSMILNLITLTKELKNKERSPVKENHQISQTQTVLMTIYQWENSIRHTGKIQKKRKKEKSKKKNI